MTSVCPFNLSFSLECLVLLLLLLSWPVFLSNTLHFTFDPVLTYIWLKQKTWTKLNKTLFIPPLTRWVFTRFSLLCTSLTDKPLQLFKGGVKCVIRLSWWADVNPTLIWDAVCVTNGPGACQPAQMRGRGRCAGHFNIRMMETLLWFSTEGAQSQIASFEKWIKLNVPPQETGSLQKWTELELNTCRCTEMIDEMQHQGFLWQNNSGLSWNHRESSSMLDCLVFALILVFFLRKTWQLCVCLCV